MTNAKQYWWVNHKQTVGYEVRGGYLWSPTQKANGQRNKFYENMTLVKPGDFIFSFANAHIGAIGVATGAAIRKRKPTEFGTAGEAWDAEGWLVPVKFEVLHRPLRPKDHMSILARSLPSKYSPIQDNGNGNQAAYLAHVPYAMAALLTGLLESQWPAIEQKLLGYVTVDFPPPPVVPETNVAYQTREPSQVFTEYFRDPPRTENKASKNVEPLTNEVLHIGRSEVLELDAADDGVVEEIRNRTDIGETQRTQLVSSRRGQGIYRRNLESFESICRVTGVTNTAHLRASHIKPWRSSNDFEKLDGNNGLLLSPHIDHLFDRGYISFGDDGTALLSPTLDTTVLAAWNIPNQLNAGRFRPEQLTYLEFHREYVFKR